MKLISTLSIIFFISQAYLHASNIHALGKKVYDATSYLHKNTLNSHIFPSIAILYEDMLLPKGTDHIDLTFLKKYALALPASKTPYILDIEAWDIRPNVIDFIANRNIDKYILVISTLKKARPDLKFGYYGVLPIRDYVTETPSKRNLEKWHHANIRAKRLAQYVDVICPDLYTFFYNNKEYWEFYATHAIKDARMYGKPIFPFIWPEYHNADKKLMGKYIDASFWKFQLDFLYKNTDSIIVWGGRNLNVTPHTSQKWDDKAPWWQTTKKTLRQHRKK